MSDGPLASVSLDLDNLWSYLRVRGDPAWERYPSYLGSAVPLALDLLDELRLRVTFFVVGIDAERDDAPQIRALAARGHEVANHSYSHPSWLQRLTGEELREEVTRAHGAIQRATGREPRGFRAPGFSWTPRLLPVLEERGYLYDASTFPTVLNPLARAYYFWRSGLDAAARKERRQLFGGFGDGFRPLRPYHWPRSSGRGVLEIPVTTFPFLRIPFHQTYLLFLARYSEPLMVAYLRAALRGCRLAGIEPSFLLHPTDFLGSDLVPQLSFFPGMELPTARKLDLLRRVLRILGERFELVGMETHARSYGHLPADRLERAGSPANTP